MADDVEQAYAPKPDPYNRPDPYALNPLTVGNRAAADRYHQQYKADYDKQQQEMDKLQASQQLTVDQMSRMLDETATKIRAARSGNVSLPLLALGANMMGPGNFGDQLGRGLRAMTGVIGQQREGEAADEEKIAGLMGQKAKLAMMPIEDRLKYIQALQQGNIAGMRAIETADIRTQAAQGPKFKDMQPRKIGDWMFTPDNPSDPTSGTLVNPTTGQKMHTGATGGGVSPEALVDPMAATGAEATEAPNPEMDRLKLGQGAPKANLHPEVLAGLPEQTANYVKMLTEGRAQLPPGRKVTGDMTYFLNLASKYDPSFSQQDWKQRADAFKAWNTGPQSVAVRQGNTAFEHMFELYLGAAQLDNTSLPAANAARNWMSENTDSSRTERFEAMKPMVIDELGKFLRGGQMTEGEKHTWEGRIKATKTPGQLQEVIQTMMGGMQDQFKTLADNKSQGFGRSYTWKDLVAPENQHLLEFMSKNKLDSPTGRQAALDELARRKAAQTGQPAPPPTSAAEAQPDKRTPANQTGQRGGYREGQRARLQDGSIVVYRNGKWGPQ